MNNEEKLWQQLRPTLWQYIEKEHMESNCNLEDGSISEDEWYQFVEIFQDGFANEISGLAVEYCNNRKEWSDEEYEWSDDE